MKKLLRIAHDLIENKPLYVGFPVWMLTMVGYVSYSYVASVGKRVFKLEKNRYEPEGN